MLTSVVTAARQPVLALALSVALVIALAIGPGAAWGDQDDPWTWPLDPRPVVVSVFDRPDSPYGPGHRGIDLAGSPGQPILAAIAGEVSFSGRVAGRGIVVVRYGDLRLTYEPVTPAVGVGEPVSQGQVLGWLSGAGSHCLPDACLHLGLRRGDTYLDPLRHLGAGPARLKPMAGGTVSDGPGVPAVPPTGGVGFAPPEAWALAPSGFQAAAAGGLTGPEAGRRWALWPAADP